MELHAIPFADKFIVYRPLRRLAFLGNAALVRYVQERAAGGAPSGGAVDAFLDGLDFWTPDPEPPTAWWPAEVHQPTLAVLLLGNACNLRCRYCYAAGGEGAAQRMNPALARAVIDTVYANARAAGASRFALSFHGGGEPTLHWDLLCSALEHARTKDLPCEISLASNGVWSERKRHYLLTHLDSLSLSCDGLPDVQNDQRPLRNGGGSFDAVMETIRAVDGAHLRYGIRMTATEPSFSRLAEGVELLFRETACPVIQVEPCFSSRGLAHADPAKEQAQAFSREFLAAFAVGGRLGRTVYYSGARPETIAATFCSAAASALVVTPEGDVVTCFETHGRAHPLESAFRIGHATPAGVHIDREALEAFAARETKRREGCRTCFCFRHCAGDCATRAIASPEHRRGRCQVNRDITRELLAWHLATGDGVWRGEGSPGGGCGDCAGAHD